MARRSTPKLSAAAEAFVRQRFQQSGSTGQRYAYRSILKRLAASANDCQVGSLRAQHLEHLFYGPGGLSETCGRTTLGKYRGDLLAFLSFCQRREWLSHDPAFLLGGIAEKSTRSTRNRYRLGAGQLLALLEYAPEPRDRALLAFVTNTACRISEALSMRVRDVRLDVGDLHVNIIKTHEEDAMPITADLDRELRRWLSHYETHAGPLARDAYLFPAMTSGRFAKGGGHDARTYRPDARINNPALIFRAVAASANVALEPGDGWHTVRRSIARIYFDAASERGHDRALRETSALLHHANTQTTERYLGIGPEKLTRDQVMRGQAFLTALVDDSKVVNLSDRKAMGK